MDHHHPAALLPGRASLGRGPLGLVGSSSLWLSFDRFRPLEIAVFARQHRIAAIKGLIAIVAMYQTLPPPGGR